MVKTKQSISIDEELVAWLNSEIETKRFASISHGIEYALTILKTQPQTKTKNITHITDPEIITESSLSLESMRQKWWNDKHIGKSIVNAGGIGLINLTNIIQKNPDLFETKEECRTWLHNKLKTDPPLIETEPTIPNIPLKQTSLKAAPINTEAGPSFTPRRSTSKCPGCGEEQLIILGSPVKLCANCGYHGGQEENSIKPQPDQQAQAPTPPTPPPTETEK